MFRINFINTRLLSVVIVCLLLSIMFPSLAIARDVEFTLSSPYWYIQYDRAGYVDITYWYPSPRHPFPYHEMMTGDWAAAVYYDGIGTDSNEAAWLTDEFIIPYINPTNSPFDFTAPANEAYNTSNDPCNPVWDFNQPSNPPYSSVQKDTGWSKIDDDKLEVTIHYEVVDLGEYGWSPLSFTDANESTYVRSERYVILQTYVFKNIHETEDINNLEFYQMLHGHPGTPSAYSLDTAGSYQTDIFDDDLENYIPYDSNHQIGNFLYDITLWNTEDYTTDHFDWMGFSSTVEPNDVGFDYFTASNQTMELAIRSRNLNGNTSMDDSEIAGAMMWYLPNIAPGESTSITLALMYGSNNWPFPTILTKTNSDPNNDCVRPFIGMGLEDNYLTYDICYDANGYPLEDVNIIDYLPIEVDYYSSDPVGTYDSNAHTVTWNIGNLSETDSNCIELVTKVNNYAKPGGEFSNFVQMQCSEGISAATVADVNVCYDGYGMDIIYVDKDANGFNNGTSWDDAYTDLRDAFTGAGSGGASVTAIWVAEGTYKPVYDTNETSYKNESFNLIEDVGVFGHFGGVGTYETSTSQRDFSDPNNETTLEGQIGASVSYAVYDILKADNVEDAVLDGFTIRGAYSGSGIFLNASDVSIVNCKFKNNRNYGIEAYNYSYPDIHNCLFMNNTSQGVRATSHCWPSVSYCTFDGNDTTSQGLYMATYTVVDVEESIFKDHTADGIYGSGGTLTLTNSAIEGNNDNGLEISDVTTTMINCSIKNSSDRGIVASNSDLTIEHSLNQSR